MIDRVVLDSNVLIKLFKEEHDSHHAKALLTMLLEKEISIIAPQLLVTETIDVCLYEKVATIDLLNNFFSALLVEAIELPKMSVRLFKKACELVDCGHPKSGYPSINDSLYHAYAITYDAVFITADKRHEAKTRGLGGICLLENWQQLDVGD